MLRYGKILMTIFGNESDVFDTTEFDIHNCCYSCKSEFGFLKCIEQNNNSMPIVCNKRGTIKYFK